MARRAYRQRKDRPQKRGKSLGKNKGKSNVQGSGITIDSTVLSDGSVIGWADFPRWNDKPSDKPSDVC